MIFDWDKIQKKLADRVMTKMEIESNPMYSSRFRKFARWWAYKVPPILSGIASFIIMIWLFSRIETKYGMNKVIIVIGLGVLFTLRSIANELSHISENRKI